MKKFDSVLSKFFSRLKKSLIELVEVEDAFGLKKSNQPLVNTRWKFRSTDDQLKLFEQWLRVQYGDLLPNNASDALWSQYVKEAYDKGQGRAFDDTNKGKKAAGQNLDFYRGSRQQFLQSSFNHPPSIEKVKLLASRVYTELGGVTEVIAVQMKRLLVDGMIQGKNPRTIAREMTQTIDGMCRNRANTIARTEIMRSHSEGQLDAFERLGVDKLGVLAEWSTAGDDRVCQLCAPLEGITLSVKEARGMLPRHPNCRCVFKPDVGVSKRKSKAQIDMAIDKSVKAEIAARR
jgi:SPP1 gp7 family putative phage head morphogenesis protein